MLDEYIKELIANNNRVIIPNFGAFLLRATSKNKNKKELSAKINDIYFSPFLKFNDELLMNHVIKKENVTQREAMDMLNQYISTIENSVKENGSYQIQGFGEFYMDNQGKIQFRIQSSARKESPKETQQAPPARESGTRESQKTGSTINEKAARKKTSTTQAKSEEQSKPKTEKQQAPTSTSAQKSEKTVKTGAGTAGSGTTGASASAGKTPPPPPPKKEKTGQSGGKRNKGLLLSIVIGVPVAVVFIWAMLNFDTVQSIFTKDERQTPAMEAMDEGTEQQRQEQEEQDQTTSEEDTASDREQIQEPAETQDQPTTQAEQSERQTSPSQQQVSRASEGKKYYIVAGSFENRENAVNFRQKLRSQGYDSEMIGERNGMHAVSYASFDNKSQAKRELQKLRNEEGVQAWLLYY
ncbi:MAG: SPOR domain-containing protein [Bacteroidales bacterium]|nr:SPOR domain-containing protein [Bacteroidales bacterium]